MNISINSPNHYSRLMSLRLSYLEALRLEVSGYLLVVVIYQVVGAGEVLIVVPHLMRQRVAQYAAVFVERFIREHSHDTAVIYPDMIAYAVPHIQAEDVQVVVLRQRVQTGLVPEYYPAVQLTKELGRHFVGDIVKDSAAFFICHGSWWLLVGVRRSVTGNSIQKVLQLL